MYVPFTRGFTPKGKLHLMAFPWVVPWYIPWSHGIPMECPMGYPMGTPTYIPMGYGTRRPMGLAAMEFPMGWYGSSHGPSHATFWAISDRSHSIFWIPCEVPWEPWNVQELEIELWQGCSSWPHEKRKNSFFFSAVRAHLIGLQKICFQKSKIKIKNR